MNSKFKLECKTPLLFDSMTAVFLFIGQFHELVRQMSMTDRYFKAGLCLLLSVMTVVTVILYYHSLYSILDFDWLIHLQITACKYRSAANNWCKYCIEHAYFENASLASELKNIFLLKCQHGSFCRVIRMRIVRYTRRKGCRKHQKSN